MPLSVVGGSGTTISLAWVASFSRIVTLKSSLVGAESSIEAVARRVKGLEEVEPKPKLKLVEVLHIFK